jgi:F-type H+-transporting ATPase subunit epsilon
MARKFAVEIVTPEKVVFSAQAESLVVPAERGYLGVLAGHAPLLCSLKPGEILIRCDGKDTHFATSGGFMEVTPKKTTLLTESVEDPAGIDVDRAREALKRAQDRLHAHDPKTDADRAQDAMSRALNRLRVASKYKDI